LIAGRERPAAMESFFSRAFENLSAPEREAYHRTVFLQMESEEAEALRLEYYRSRLRHLGEGVRIGPGVRLLHPKNISLADGVSIGADCTLVAKSDRGISLGEGTRLMHRVYLDTENTEGYIETGERVYLGTGCCLHGHKGLEIGDDALLAQTITITPFSHCFEDPEQPIIKQGGHSRKITLGRDCYLGMNVSILWSADVGEGAVVGSGSVVVHSVPPYTVAVGNPARVIRRRGPQPESPQP